MTIRDAEQHHLSRARLLAEGFSRVVATALVATLNVAGWMVLFAGAWRIGLWIVLLSAGILAIVLWDGAGDRD